MQREDIKNKISIYKEYETIEGFKNFLNNLPENEKDNYFRLVIVESEDENCSWAIDIGTTGQDLDDCFYIGHYKIVNNMLLDIGAEDEIDALDTIEECIDIAIDELLNYFDMCYEE